MQNYQPNYDQAPYVPKPDNNLVMAIICTACCCLPAGIYAIVRANDVNSLHAMGKYAEAQKAANDAKKWSLIGMAASAVIGVLYGIFYLGVILIAANS